LHFGHHDDQSEPVEQEVDVEIRLEHDITLVQDATDAFLGNPSEASRQSLLTALEGLDRQTAASDAFEESIVGSAVFGAPIKGSVIGETSLNPIAEELPSSVFRAQVTLVKAAKAAVESPGTDTLHALHLASSSLTSLRPSEPEDADGEDSPAPT
jgi:hypothetical protein